MSYCAEPVLEQWDCLLEQREVEMKVQEFRQRSQHAGYHVLSDGPSLHLRATLYPRLGARITLAHFRADRK
jgi:hypothetical protein